MNNKNSSLWVTGLLTGAVLGYYLYKNRDKMPEQKEKLKTLISDLERGSCGFENSNCSV